MAMNFNDYRAKISIAEIAEVLGYTKISSPNSRHLEYILGGAQVPEDEIVIYPNGKGYFSRKGQLDDKGDLIKFIFNRLDKFTNCSDTGYKGVNEVLSKYLGSDLKVTNSSFIKAQEKSISFNINKISFSPLKETTFNYLNKKRHLSKETITSFKNRLLIYSVGSKENAGFPFRKPGQMEITNFEMRNYDPETKVNFKGFCLGGDKANSCWIANFVPFDQVTDIYLFESGIDAMSFYEINHFNDKTTSAFTSIGGYVSQKQIDNIKSVFPNSKVNWHCCFDNDVSGKCYDITTAYYLSGEECKAYKKPKDNGYMVNVSFPTGESYSWDERNFCSAEFLKLENKNEIIDIIKPPKYKDWNELLTYYKRFDLNLGPGMKFLPAIDEIKSQLNLRGHIYVSEMFETKGKELIQSLMDKATYTLTAPLAETNTYKLIVDCNVFMGIDTMVPVPTNLYIFDKTTQKTINAHSINEFLKKEYINIFRDLTANDFKNLLEKKVLTYTKGNVERKFEGILSPSGWSLKECDTLKKKDIDLEFDF